MGEGRDGDFVKSTDMNGIESLICHWEDYNYHQPGENLLMVR